jgi:phospholipase/carboxylesterase
MSTVPSRPIDLRVRPAAGTPQGALILLHGRGADEHDLHPLLDVFDPQRRLLGLTPGGPLSLPPGGRHWYVVPRVGFPEPATFGATYADLTTLLDERLAEHGLGWDRTVLGGFSQGAVMSYAVGLGEGRPLPAGILAMSGFIPTVDGWQLRSDGLQDFPVAIAHGSMDPVISVEFARDAKARLETAGADVLYRESPMAHTIDPRVIPDLQAWVRDRV